MNFIRLESKKQDAHLNWAIQRIPPVTRVRVPLGSASGSEAELIVELGAQVKAGEKIGEPKTQSSVAVHASISGKITDIGIFPHPVLGECLAIEITSDKKEEKISGTTLERAGWQNLSREELLSIFRDSGLVEMDAHEAPLHEKIQESAALILDATEPEPYVSADHSLVMSHALEILKGAEILKKVTGARSVQIIITEDKREAAELLKSKIFFLKWSDFSVEIVKDRYPAIPSSSSSPRLNISTAFTVYEAAVHQKPFYERPVTIAGECIFEPKNIWLPVGISFEAAIKACRGLLREPRKIIMGGPMRGMAQSSTAVCVAKGTQAILALPPEVAHQEIVEPCIRCGRCVEVCPEDLSPVMISLASEKKLYDLAREYGAETCTACGNCAYICPAHRPMVELIQKSYESTH